MEKCPFGQKNRICLDSIDDEKARGFLWGLSMKKQEDSFGAWLKNFQNIYTVHHLGEVFLLMITFLLHHCSPSVPVYCFPIKTPMAMHTVLTPNLPSFNSCTCYHMHNWAHLYGDLAVYMFWKFFSQAPKESSCFFMLRPQMNPLAFSSSAPKESPCFFIINTVQTYSIFLPERAFFHENPLTFS